jgi:hypothetical protein
MATKYNLVIDQGSDFKLKLSFKTNEEVRDLTGYSIRGYARKTINGPTNFQFATSVVNTNTFLLTVLATVSDTIEPGIYLYDIELYNATQIERVLEGKITVTPGVTR